MIIYCDIDGTISDDRHRHALAPTEYSDKRSAQWDKFHAACSKDPPYEEVIGLLQYLTDVWDATVILFTGRNEKVRDKTVRWMRKHEVPFTELLMRPADNRDPTVLLKLHWLKASGDDDIIVIENDPTQAFVLAEHHGYTVWNIRRGVVKHVQGPG